MEKKKQKPKKANTQDEGCKVFNSQDEMRQAENFSEISSIFDGNPFVCFDEWAGQKDSKAYDTL